MAKWIADALIADVRREAADHGVDLWTWLPHSAGSAAERRLPRETRRTVLTKNTGHFTMARLGTKDGPDRLKEDILPLR